jgi:phosphatidate phosphatase APP1
MSPTNQTESSKFDIRNSKQIRIPKLEFWRRIGCAIRFSSLFRISSFGFRILIPALICWRAAGQSSNLKRDQEVVFFPTLACRSGSNCWDLNIHGCVYEPDKRTVALALIRAALGLEHVSLTPAENKLFAERARLFMVDHKADKKIVVRIGDAEFTLPKSGANGHFSTVIQLSDAQVEKLRSLSDALQVVMPAKDSRKFAGELSLFGDTGVIVVSDIDDTIKITQVRDRKATLRNTFLEPFQPVPGMAQVYRGWAQKAGAQLCYVSASPWQLYSPIADFIRSNGFPAGVFYLKSFRWKDESFFNLFEGPEKYKPGVIKPLMQRFPNRRFVFVGDSGERDPEIYGALAREYPQQVAKILIRDVTEEGPDAERFKTAFRELPPTLWKVFQNSAEIADLVH